MDEPTANALEALPGIAEPLTDAIAFEDLVPAWRRLCDEADSRPFARPQWVEAWLRHGDPHGEPVFLSVRLGDEIVGVAALAIARDTARALGDPDVSDYPPLVSLPGYEEVLAQGVLEWLREDLTARLEVWGVAEDSPLRPAFAAAAERLGWRIEEEAEGVAPRAELQGSWDAYLAGLGKHDRHELRRKMRNVARAGQAVYREVTNADACRHLLDSLFHLMRASHEGKAHFLTPEREAFFRDAVQGAVEGGFGRIGVLELDGATAAMVVCLENRSARFLYNSGYDPRLARLAVGFVAKAHAIEQAAARGVQVFDFLRGNEEYKRHMGGRPYQLFRLRLESLT